MQLYLRLFVNDIATYIASDRLLYHICVLCIALCWPSKVGKWFEVCYYNGIGKKLNFQGQTETFKDRPNSLRTVLRN